MNPQLLYHSSKHQCGQRLSCLQAICRGLFSNYERLTILHTQTISRAAEERSFVPSTLNIIQPYLLSGDPIGETSSNSSSSQNKEFQQRLSDCCNCTWSKPPESQQFWVDLIIYVCILCDLPKQPFDLMVTSYFSLQLIRQRYNKLAWTFSSVAELSAGYHSIKATP